MQDAPAYDDVLLDVLDFLEARVAAAEAAGIPRGAHPRRSRGSASARRSRTTSRSIRGLAVFHGLGCGDPLRRLAQALHRHDRRSAGRAATACPGSIAVALEALRQGAQVIRVHDVKETRQALGLWWALNGDEEQ